MLPPGTVAVVLPTSTAKVVGAPTPKVKVDPLDVPREPLKRLSVYCKAKL